MTICDTYGTSTHTAADLARLLTDRLGLTFTERDSDCRGIYFLGDALFGHIEIQPNAIPGDGDEDDLYDPEHAAIHTLLLVTQETPDSTLKGHLEAVDGLEKLAHESF